MTRNSEGMSGPIESRHWSFGFNDYSWRKLSLWYQIVKHVGDTTKSHWFRAPNSNKRQSCGDQIGMSGRPVICLEFLLCDFLHRQVSATSLTYYSRRFTFYDLLLFWSFWIFEDIFVEMFGKVSFFSLQDLWGTPRKHFNVNKTTELLAHHVRYPYDGKPNLESQRVCPFMSWSSSRLVKRVCPKIVLPQNWWFSF